MDQGLSTMVISAKTRAWQSTLWSGGTIVSLFLSEYLPRIFELIPLLSHIFKRDDTTIARRCRLEAKRMDR